MSDLLAVARRNAEDPENIEEYLAREHPSEDAADPGAAGGGGTSPPRAINRRRRGPPAAASGSPSGADETAPAHGGYTRRGDLDRSAAGQPGRRRGRRGGQHRGDAERATRAADRRTAHLSPPSGGRLLWRPAGRASWELSIGTRPGRPAAAGRPYARPGRPLLLGLELIATIANASPGADGLYRSRQAAVIDRYPRGPPRPRAARARHPARSSRLPLGGGAPAPLAATAGRRDRARSGVARAGRRARPGDRIGVGGRGQPGRGVPGRHRPAAALPQKLFVVHRFTEDMVGQPELIKRHRELATAFNVDGIGDRANKESKYHAFSSATPRIRQGFKLFYEEDLDLMSPREVLALRPPPDRLRVTAGGRASVERLVHQLVGARVRLAAHRAHRPALELAQGAHRLDV